jgi:hypothetical protein
MAIYFAAADMLPEVLRYILKGKAGSFPLIDFLHVF